MSFKICIIGCGGMAKGGHGPSYIKYQQKYPDTILAGCCDLNEEAAQDFKDKFNFDNAYTNYNTMLDAEKPDVVCVITTERVTKKVSVDVLRKGYPVLLEKPPGLDDAEAQEIVQAAKEADLPARVAFNRRYMPLVQALKEELRNNPDPVLNVDYMFMRIGRTDKDFSTTAIHGIDTAKYLAGSDYAMVNFQYNPVEYKDSVCQNTTLTCKFESNATGNLTFLPSGGCVIERAIVTVKDYTYFLELPIWSGLDTPGKLVCVHNGHVTKSISGDELCSENVMFITNGFYKENELFFDQLKSGEKIEQDVSSGIQSVEVAQYMRAYKEQYRK